MLADLDTPTQGTLLIHGEPPARAAGATPPRRGLSGSRAPALAQRRGQHPAAAGSRWRARRPPDAVAGLIDLVGSAGLRAGAALPALGRDAAAGLDRPRPGRGAGGAAARRAVRRPRPDDAAADEPGAAADLDRAGDDDGAGDARHRGGGLPGRPRRRDVAATGSHRRGRADRSARPRQPEVMRSATFHAICDRLSDAALRQRSRTTSPRPPERVSLARATDCWIDGLIGVVAVLVLWQLLATTVLAGSRVVPPPLAVVCAALAGPRLLSRQHLGDVARGVDRVRLGQPHRHPARRALRSGPRRRDAGAAAGHRLLQHPAGGDRADPDRGACRRTDRRSPLAALSVFFTTLIATGLGLRAADPDLARRGARLRRRRLDGRCAR